jgi:IS4 transposase
MDAFPVFSERMERVDFLGKFKKLRHGESTEFYGYIKNPKGDLQKVRVCAMRKSAAECERARKRVQGRAKRKGQSLKESTEKFNEYIVLAASLPPKITKDEVLATYRLRWQVENYFKRLKSVLGFGDLPKKKEKTSLAWLNGKMMVALLIETLIAGSFFSLKWKEESEAEYLAGDQDC